MQFVSLDDLRRAYNNTYVSYKGVVAHAVTDGYSIILYPLNGDANIEVNAKKQFFFDPLSLGYCPDIYGFNRQNSLVYLSRRPLRQWQQGLSDKTLSAVATTFEADTGTIKKTGIRLSLEQQLVRKMLQRQYESFDIVVKNGGGGLSKDYGLLWNHSVLFNGAEIGKWYKNGIGLYPNYYINSIIRQDLEETLKVPVIWKKERNEKEQKDGMDA